MLPCFFDIKNFQIYHKLSNIPQKLPIAFLKNFVFSGDPSSHNGGHGVSGVFPNLRSRYPVSRVDSDVASGTRVESKMLVTKKIQDWVGWWFRDYYHFPNWKVLANSDSLLRWGILNP